MMMESNPIVVHGDGLQTRSLTWIHDVTEGLLKVNDASNLSGKAFNLGTNGEISMLDLATKIAKLRGVDVDIYYQVRLFVESACTVNCGQVMNNLWIKSITRFLPI